MIHIFILHMITHSIQSLPISGKVKCERTIYSEFLYNIAISFEILIIMGGGNPFKRTEVNVPFRNINMLNPIPINIIVDLLGGLHSANLMIVFLLL